MFTGCGTALVTPFRPDQTLDEAALRRLVRRQIEAGIDFLVPCGTTGESPTLTHEEHLRVVEITIDEARGKMPVLAGAGGYNTAEVIHLANELRDLGADGILSVTPYYNKPTQEGLYQHFRTIAEAVDLPVILYNVPGRTVADMGTATTLRLAEVPGIVGIKDATGDIARGSDLIRRLRLLEKTSGRRFGIYSGNDDSALALMAMGSDGVISVTANVAPKPMADMCRLALAGDFAGARTVNNILMPLHFDLFVEANPIPAKWMLARMGRCNAKTRLPMTPLSAKFEPVLEAAMRHAALL